MNTRSTYCASALRLTKTHRAQARKLQALRPPTFERQLVTIRMDHPGALSAERRSLQLPEGARRVRRQYVVDEARMLILVDVPKGQRIRYDPQFIEVRAAEDLA